MAEFGLDEGLHVAAADLLVEECLADALDELLRGVRTEVGKVEPFLKLGEEGLVDAALPSEQLGDAAEEAARLGEALLDLGEEVTKAS